MNQTIRYIDNEGDDIENKYSSIKGPVFPSLGHGFIDVSIYLNKCHSMLILFAGTICR